MTTKGTSGQGLLEAAIVLPVLVLLLAGIYACCRAAFLHSAAESSAHAEAIRTGRGLSSIERRMSEDILPNGEGVAVRSENGDESRLLPSPFPSLAGRTKGIADVRKEWKEIGRPNEFAPLHAVRSSEASVDCWDRSSGSGRRIRVVVEGFVATGVLR